MFAGITIDELIAAVEQVERSAFPERDVRFSPLTSNIEKGPAVYEFPYNTKLINEVA